MEEFKHKVEDITQKAEETHREIKYRRVKIKKKNENSYRRSNTQLK